MAREYKVVRVEIDADRLAALCRRLGAAELRGHPRNVEELRELAGEAGLDLPVEVAGGPLATEYWIGVGGEECRESRRSQLELF